MLKVMLSEEQLNNLMNLLDRVEIKGFKEIRAMTDLIQALQAAKKPIEKNIKNVEED